MCGESTEVTPEGGGPHQSKRTSRFGRKNTTVSDNSCTGDHKHSPLPFPPLPSPPILQQDSMELRPLDHDGRRLIEERRTGDEEGEESFNISMFSATMDTSLNPDDTPQGASHNDTPQGASHDVSPLGVSHDDTTEGASHDVAPWRASRDDTEGASHDVAPWGASHDDTPQGASHDVAPWRASHDDTTQGGSHDGAPWGASHDEISSNDSQRTQPMLPSSLPMLMSSIKGTLSH